MEVAIEQSHEALRRILNGNPSGNAALFADRDDITLGNPFGPFGNGRVAVLQTLNNASTKYREGSVVKVDRVAAYGDGKIFCIVEIEHDRAKLGANPDFAEFAARVTSVYEKDRRPMAAGASARRSDYLCTARGVHAGLNRSS